MSLKNSGCWCIVPTCKNTGKSNPNKIFINVPSNKLKRKMWLDACGNKSDYSSSSRLYCCEDHFDLKTDMENYLEWKIIGGNKRMKNNILPHKYIEESKLTSAEVSPMEVDQQSSEKSSFNSEDKMIGRNSSNNIDNMDLEYLDTVNSTASQVLENMEASRVLVLSSGSRVDFNNDFVEWLTKQCLEHNILHPSVVNKIMQLKLQYDVANLLKNKLTRNDMDEIMQWLRRVLYEKAKLYITEKGGLETAPDWLLQAVMRLRLLPAEQLPQPVGDMVLSSHAISELLRRVCDTRGKLPDPLLQLIWEDVSRTAMTKLHLLVKQGDQLTVGSNIISITDIEWRIIDNVLLDSSSEQYLLVLEDSLDALVQKVPLMTLCQLVQDHRLSECVGREELARRWGRAHDCYIAKGFYLSLVALQRRWFELRRYARDTPQWGLATRVRQVTIDTLAASFSWTDLVDGGMVFTHQDAIVSEILNSTPQWKPNCDLRVFGEGDGNTSVSVESAMVNDDLDLKPIDTGGIAGKQTPSANVPNKSALPRKTGRFSSLLIFESDDDDLSSDDNIEIKADSPSKNDSEEDVISLSEAILRIESDAVTAKRPKLAIHSISTTFDPNITLFSAPNSLEVSVSPDDTDLKTPPTVILPVENIKQENGDSESIGQYPCSEFTKKSSCLPEVPPPSDCVMFDEVIDQKLLMNALVVIERMDFKKYMEKRHTAKKSSKKSKSIYLEEDDSSSRDSGSEWSPESAEESASWSSEETWEGRADESRPVTLRDIDEVRRRAQRKLTAQVAPVTPAAHAPAHAHAHAHIATATAATADIATTATTTTITTTATTAATTTTATIATTTPTAPTTVALVQESSFQNDASAPLVDSNTVIPPIAVEVREYCPLGLKATRLRYGQGMYRREMDAAAAAHRRRLRRESAQGKKKTRQPRQKNNALRECEELPRETNPATESADGHSQEDDMCEWIRQRNLNSLYFGPKSVVLPNPKLVAQRRSSNPIVGVNKAALLKTRASSLGNDPTPTISTFKENITTTPQLQSRYPVLTKALISTNSQMSSSVTSNHQSSGVTHIAPNASIKQSATSLLKTQQLNGSSPQQDANISPTNQSGTSNLRLLLEIQGCTDPAKIPKDCAALWPIRVIPAQSKPEETKEVDDGTVVNIEDGSSSDQSRDDGGRSEMIKSKVVEDPNAIRIDVTNTLTTPPYNSKIPPPLIKLTLMNTNTLVSENAIFGNRNTVTAQEYIKDEDGSRLKIICKHVSTPFWLSDNEFMVLAEKFDEKKTRNMAFYTLAPLAEIKRIVFDESITGDSALVEGAGGMGTASGAPLRLAVQGKLYRKLCSAPLRYAQVLCAVRCAQHARRIVRRGGALLLYHARRGYLTPLQHLDTLLTNHSQGPTEEIVIDD